MEMPDEENQFKEVLDNQPASIASNARKIRWLDNFERAYIALYVSAIVGYAAYANKALVPPEISDYPAVAAVCAVESELEEKVGLIKPGSEKKVLLDDSRVHSRLLELKSTQEYGVQSRVFNQKQETANWHHKNWVGIGLFGYLGILGMALGFNGRRNKWHQEMLDETAKFHMDANDKIYGRKA